MLSWALLAWAGMSILWRCPSSIFSANQRFVPNVYFRCPFAPCLSSAFVSFRLSLSYCFLFTSQSWVDFATAFSTSSYALKSTRLEDLRSNIQSPAETRGWAGRFSLLRFSSVQSLKWLDRRADTRDDSAEILFQSFLREALVNSSGMGRDVSGCPLVRSPSFSPIFFEGKRVMCL